MVEPATKIKYRSYFVLKFAHEYCGHSYYGYARKQKKRQAYLTRNSPAKPLSESALKR